MSIKKWGRAMQSFVKYSINQLAFVFMFFCHKVYHWVFDWESSKLAQIYLATLLPQRVNNYPLLSRHRQNEALHKFLLSNLRNCYLFSSKIILLLTR